MPDYEVLGGLTARDDDVEGFARDLAEDLTGENVTVLWDMSNDEIRLARVVDE